VSTRPSRIKRLTLAKKNKQKVNRELEALGRRGLKDVRVIVKGCVYVTGMAVGQEGRAEEVCLRRRSPNALSSAALLISIRRGHRARALQQLATLRSNDYFGQYGKISKLVLHKRPASGGGASAADGASSAAAPPAAVGIYITYLRREDAARAIAALDGFPSPSVPGTVLRASFGTAKYCESWLRNVRCELGQACMGLHEWGDERDVFRREDLTTLNVGIRKPTVVQPDVGAGSAGAIANGGSAGGKLGKGRAEIDCACSAPRTPCRPISR
jgi:CCR4-NOT transcription complex subunit 4